MEMNLKELKIIKKALENMEIEVDIESKNFNEEFDKRFEVRDLENKVYKEIKRLENEEFENSDDPFAKLMKASK